MAFPETYRAYQYENYGPIEKELKIHTGLPQLKLDAQQVRVKVRSAALNPIDHKVAEFYGQMMLGKAPTAEHPFGIGFDAAGEVVGVGSGVQRLKVGDAVYASTPTPIIGTLAEYLILDEDAVALKPGNLDFNEAAGVPLVAFTAYAGMVNYTKLEKGETILVVGGSTAVGMFAIQLAHDMGARVIATTSTRNVELVKLLGADHVVDYTKEKWLDVLEPHSVDVVYDCGVDPMAWNNGAQVVLKAKTGRFATLLPMSESAIDSEFGAKLLGFLSVEDKSAETLAKITKYIEAGKVKPVVDSIYPFDKALEAFAKLKTGHAQGKIVVKVHP